MIKWEWKMGTIVVFQLLVLDSLKYSSKAESPINRSAKAVISRNLTTSRDDHLFPFVFFLSFQIFYLIFHTFRKQTCIYNFFKNNHCLF